MILIRFKSQLIKNLKLKPDTNKRLNNLLGNIMYFHFHLVDLIENVVHHNSMDSIFLKRMTTY